MENQKEEQIINDEEITLKELILKVKEFIYELWSHKFMIALFCVPFLVYMLYKAIRTPVTYPASLTFMVDDQDQGGISPFSSILGQFGFPARRGAYNLDRILELSKSRLILQNALFTKTTIKGNEDFLANFFIDQLDLQDDWKDDTSGMKDFKFTHTDISQFNKNEYKALKKVIGKIKGNEKKPGIYATDYDTDTGVMQLSVKSPSEVLSIRFLDTLYIKLSEYYINNTIEKAQQTYALVLNKRDSIFNELSNAQYALSKFQDENRNILLRTEGSLKETRLQQKVAQYQVMYTEVVKQVEIADMSLKSATPYITLIDNPIPPLAPEKPSKLITLIKALILGVFVGSFFVIARKIYFDAMRS